MSDVYITGCGIISALGYGKETTMDALRQHKSAVGKIRFLRTEHTELPVGEVPFSNDEMRQILGIQEDTIMTRTALIGRMALKEALDEAQLNPQRQRTAFINGTTVGGMDRTELFEKDFIKTHDCGTCSEMIAEQSGGFCFVTTMSTACSSAANAILLGKELIETGRVDVAVVGGAECITKFHLNGFNTLMILDKDVCRPFDKTRTGLNLGEGAGYIVLESEKSVKKRNIKPLAILSGVSNRCDAFHQTATSTDGEGAYLAMTEALKDANLNPSDIDYINAHGTGTGINDMSEGRAITRIFGGNVPPTASVKAYIGHTTSAAGGVEAVISILALKHNYIPICLNFNEKDDDLGFEPLHEEKPHKEIRHVMSNSFGFGGNDTVCIFSKITKDEIDSQNVSLNNCFPIKITCAAQISAQKPLSDEWFDNPIQYGNGTFIKSQDADYKQFINPMTARRMGSVLKRAIATSKTVMEESGIATPDAIITATGWGCLENTEKFLNSMTEQGESCLQPTFFINSTHNTIGSNIAILTKNHGYNNTHVQQGISFESALLDAVIQFEQGKIGSALVGAFDEMTPQWHRYLVESGKSSGGVFDGETAVSTILSRNGDVELVGVEILHQPDFQHIEVSVKRLCDKKNLKTNDIDLVVTGRNNCAENDVIYEEFENGFGFKNKTVTYKNIFGESFTSSAFGFYFAFECLKKGFTPENKKVNNILIYNHFNNVGHTLILLSKC